MKRSSARIGGKQSEKQYDHGTFDKAALIPTERPSIYSFNHYALSNRTPQYTQRLKFSIVLQFLKVLMTLYRKNEVQPHEAEWGDVAGILERLPAARLEIQSWKARRLSKLRLVQSSRLKNNHKQQTREPEFHRIPNRRVNWALSSRRRMLWQCNQRKSKS